MNLLLDKIDLDNTPQHIAIIMDGNGRWAKKRGLLRTTGHKNGVKSVRNVIEACNDVHIKYLTLYAFSSENWNRPKNEVNTLMNLLISTLRKEINEFNKNNVRLNIIGNIETLPSKVQKELQEALELTKNNTKATLTVALSYGSQNEILEAVKKIASDIKNGLLTPNHINKEIFEANLQTHDLPPVDLLIRTSGEQRISNFLLWQIAYAELYFTDILWPDFQKENLYEAVLSYQNRERRYGKTSEQLV
ncbi:MAG: isoprenyl transferase [Flavobacteriales bacterium]